MSRYARVYGRLVQLLDTDQDIQAVLDLLSSGDEEEDVEEGVGCSSRGERREGKPFDVNIPRQPAPQLPPSAATEVEGFPGSPQLPPIQQPPSPQPGPSGYVPPPLTLDTSSSPSPPSPPVYTELQPAAAPTSAATPAFPPLPASPPQPPSPATASPPPPDSPLSPASPPLAASPAPPAPARQGQQRLGARVRAGLARRRGRGGRGARVGARRVRQPAPVVDEGWEDTPFHPRHGPFTGTPGLNVPVPASVLGYFQLFFTRELLRYLAEETNRYGDHKSKPHTPFIHCNELEMAKFLGLLILMGIIIEPTLRHYWSSDELYGHAVFPATMSGRRWRAILAAFHTFNVKAVPIHNRDRLIKVRPVMEYFIRLFKQVYTPTEHLSLDEGGMPWRGSLNFRVFNPQKPEKYVIKMYMLAESQTGYMYNFDVYTGMYRTTQDTVCDLVADLLGKGYKLYMDNYYNSVGLCNRLFDQQVYVCGTMRLVRGAPRELQQIAKGRLADDTVLFRHKENVMVLLWKDKRVVNMISTFHGSETVEKQRRQRVRGRDGRFEYQDKIVNKPIVVEEYNRYMSGVDLFDQMIQYYSFTRKTQKWTKKIVFYFMQMAIYNSFVLYRKFSSDEKPLTMIQYHEHIIKKLIHFRSEEWPMSGHALQHAPDLPEGQWHCAPFVPRGGAARRPVRGRAAANHRPAARPAFAAPALVVLLPLPVVVLVTLSVHVALYMHVDQPYRIQWAKVHLIRTHLRL